MADYYRHFKGNKYKLLGIAKDSETQEKMVVYQALYGEGEMWVRPENPFGYEDEYDEDENGNWIRHRLLDKNGTIALEAVVEFEYW